MLIKLARLALAFLWIFSGLTALFFAPKVGYEILSRSGITGTLADAAVYVGSFLDISLGVWLLSARWLRFCCLVQVIAIVMYTLVLSVISASLWLHPFGPLTKNIPIIVLIGVVYASDK